MTSSTKPEVHNVLQCLQKSIEIWPLATCTENLVKSGCAVPEIDKIDKMARQIHSSHTTLPFWAQQKFLVYLVLSWKKLQQQQQHPFNGSLSRTTWVSQYQKGKTDLDLLEQETMSGSGISWAVCISAPWPRQIIMPAPHHSVFGRPYYRSSLWHSISSVCRRRLWRFVLWQNGTS